MRIAPSLFHLVNDNIEANASMSLEIQIVVLRSYYFLLLLISGFFVFPSLVDYQL